LQFLSHSEHPRLAELGTSCPDHFLRTKVKPLVLDLPADASVEQLLALAQQASDDANAALTAGNLTEWAADIQRMQALVNLANQKAQSEGSGGTPTTTAPTGATTTTRPRSTSTTVARA